MKIVVKQLQGSECCLEVEPSTSILEIKREIAKKLNVEVTSQKLLYLGKTLADEQHFGSYPAIKDGSKLNLAVKKPDTLYDVSFKKFKKMGLSDAQAAKAANKLLVVVKDKFNQLSLDDLERLSKDFLMVKAGKRSLRVDNDVSDDPSVL